MIASQSLDRGPGVVVVVPDSPAAAAGVRPGDIVTAIDERALPPKSRCPHRSMRPARMPAPIVSRICWRTRAHAGLRSRCCARIAYWSPT
ncbi:PDZ domain-containing protein [Sphingomonas aurantiaca]|uniref:PDZ domain-containing protein n=1 Tax=Sphingomonas aurantiaca TaxID=185949 RepID=UPI003A5C2044